MSTARLIPETWELSGDDAWRTLRRTGRRRLLADAFQRLRWADGFSHARSLAFLVALAASRGSSPSSAWPAPSAGRPSATSSSAPSKAPPRARWPALLTDAVDAGPGQRRRPTTTWPLILGTVGWLVTATTAMGQLERGLNRLYGVEQDRPFLQKYGLALLLAASSGVLLAAGLRAARLRPRP